MDADGEARLKAWLLWVYEEQARELRRAVGMLEEGAAFFEGNVWVGLAIGDVERVRAALDADAGWVNRPGGPLGMTPLVAVTHSLLIREVRPDGEGFEAGLLSCARLLLERGADVKAGWIHRDFPDSPLSPLYGAAGKTHHVGMTRLMLEAGADPNDNESLYHSVESDDPACALLLLEHGARVAGSNALGRVLDYDKLELLKALLTADGDAAVQGRYGKPLHHAMLRGRSIEHVRALVEAGADLRAVDKDGVSVLRYAAMHGRGDVIALLQAAGVGSDPSESSAEERFVSACARGDLSQALELLDADTEMFSRLSQRQLEVLPELAGVGDMRGVRTMLAAGWPREVKTGWGATALNQAVFRGDAAMTALLLQEGADWRTEHNFKNNVWGTLSWASLAEDDLGGPGDYVGCARALLEGGVPLPGEGRSRYSVEVEEFLSSMRG